MEGNWECADLCWNQIFIKSILTLMNLIIFPAVVLFLWWGPIKLLWTEATTKEGSATLLKKRLWHRYFPANFLKFLRTSFVRNTSGRLILSEFLSIKFPFFSRQCFRVSRRSTPRGRNLKQNWIILKEYFNLTSGKRQSRESCENSSKHTEENF